MAVAVPRGRAGPHTTPCAGYVCGSTHAGEAVRPRGLSIAALSAAAVGGAEGVARGGRAAAGNGVTAGAATGDGVAGWAGLGNGVVSSRLGLGGEARAGSEGEACADGADVVTDGHDADCVPVLAVEGASCTVSRQAQYKNKNVYA